MTNQSCKKCGAPITVANTEYCDRCLQGVANSLEFESDIYETELQTADFGLAKSTDTAGIGHIETRNRLAVADQVGEGGMGIVYSTDDLSLSRTLVAKFLRDDHLDNETARNQFLFEGRLQAGLDHPGIVKVFGIGQRGDGVPFYTMSKIEGEELSEIIKQVRKPDDLLGLRQLLRHFVDVCNIISYAHSRGVMHADIKPKNIMIGEHGQTLVIDWGMATLSELAEDNRIASDAEEAGIGNASVSKSRSTGKTPAYMCAEQCIEGAEYTPRSDVALLGSTLYHILTGTAPYSAKSLQNAIDMALNADFILPSKVRADVPKPLEAICVKAMASDPSARYESAKALSEDIESWLADLPIGVYRDPLSVRLNRWARKHRALVTGVTATVSMAIVGLLVGTLLLTQAYKREQTAKLNEQEQKRIAIGQRDALREYDYAFKTSQAGDALSVGNLARARALISASGPDGVGAEFRGWEWDYLRTACDNRTRYLAGHDADVTSLALSPDGSTLASGDESGGIVIWDCDTHQPIHHFAAGEQKISALAFTQDATRLFVGD